MPEGNQNGQEDKNEEKIQEYYLDTIQDIVDDQKEKLGEKTALKWARRAPIKIDQQGNVTGFYGTGEDALETLREFTEHEEFYMQALQDVIDHISDFMGEKLAFKFARKAPLRITPDGEVKAYYGTGRKALQILIKSYEEYLGEQVADSQIQSIFQDIDKDKRKLVPEEVRPDMNETKNERSDDKGLINQILR